MKKYEEEFELNNIIGLLYVELGKFKDAEHHYKLVLDKCPNNLDILFNLVNLCSRKYKDN